MSGYCGTDYHPQEGVACDGETSPVPVCGMCTSAWWHAQLVTCAVSGFFWWQGHLRGLNKSYQFGPKLHWYETIETLPHPTLLEIMVKSCSQCEIHRESRSYKTGPTWRITSEYGNRTSEMFRYIYICSTWAIMCDLIVPDMVLVRHQLICCSSCNSGSSCNVHDAAVWCSLKLRSMFYSTLDCTTWPYLIQANFVALSPQHTGFSFTQVNKNQNLHSHHQPLTKKLTFRWYPFRFCLPSGCDSGPEKRQTRRFEGANLESFQMIRDMSVWCACSIRCCMSSSALKKQYPANYQCTFIRRQLVFWCFEQTLGLSKWLAKRLFFFWWFWLKTSNLQYQLRDELAASPNSWHTACNQPLLMDGGTMWFALRFKKAAMRFASSDLSVT